MTSASWRSPAIRKIISTVLLTGFPIFVFVMGLLASPGYYEPMLHHPTGIGLLIGCVIWLAIGAFLLLTTDGWLRALVVFFFPVVTTVIVQLGPAVITIITAIGPVVK